MNATHEPANIVTAGFLQSFVALLQTLLRDAIQDILPEILEKLQQQLGTTEPGKLLLSAREATEVLGGICEKSLWNNTIPRGTIPSINIGSRVMYSPVDLQLWIDEQKEEGQEP